MVPGSTLALVSPAAYRGWSSGRKASVSVSILAWDNSFACSRPCQRTPPRIRAAVSPEASPSRRLLHREGFSLRVQRCLAWHPSAATGRHRCAARAHQRRLHVRRGPPASASSATALDMIDGRSQHGEPSVGVCARVRAWALGR